MEQLLAHIFGDFCLQSDWMAMNKSRRTLPCLVHVLIYTGVFLLLTTSWKALLVIGITHFILDRWPIIIRKMIWWKNHFPNGYPHFSYCNSTGYYDDSPYTSQYRMRDFYKANAPSLDPHEPRHFFITIWLYIITDNFLHLTINYFALKYLT